MYSTDYLVTTINAFIYSGLLHSEVRSTDYLIASDKYFRLQCDIEVKQVVFEIVSMVHPNDVRPLCVNREYNLICTYGARLTITDVLARYISL